MHHSVHVEELGLLKQLDVVRGERGGELGREHGAPRAVVVQDYQGVGGQRLEVREVQVPLNSLLLGLPRPAGVSLLPRQEILGLFNFSTLYSAILSFALPFNTLMG